MDLTRSSLFATMFYTVLFIVLFIGGAAFADSTAMAGAAQSGAELEAWNFFSPVSSWFENVYIVRIVAGLLVFVLSLMVASIAIKRVMYMENNYMPSVLYVLICTSYNVDNLDIASLVCAILIAIAFSRGLKSYRYKHIASKQLLTSSFYFGLSALICPETIYVAPLMFAILLMFRPFDVKELIVVVAGLTFPMALYFLWVWTFGGDVAAQWGLYIDRVISSDGSIDKITSLEVLKPAEYAFVGVCALLFVLSFIKYVKIQKYFKKYSSLSYRFFAFSALWSIAAMFLAPGGSILLLPIVAIGLSVVIPIYFKFAKSSLLANLIYIVLLLSAVAIHLGHYLWQF